MEFRDREVSYDRTQDSEIDLLDSDDDEHLTMSSFIPRLPIFSPCLIISLFVQLYILTKPKSKARWDSEMRMVEVLEHKGRCWITTELFMVEKGALLVVNSTDDMVLSLTDMYFMLNEGRNGCTWDSFLVYKHLKSRGYIVGRHGVQWTLKNENYPSTPTCGFEITDGFINMQMNISAKPVFDLYLPSNKFKKSSPGVPDSVVYLTTRKRYHYVIARIQICKSFFFFFFCKRDVREKL
ncbi:hypothetical protein MKW92_035175 [Papaver armeniacum]|nr:hypothetical protein MKW92_035175 [Papaver armeniacum]